MTNKYAFSLVLSLWWHALDHFFLQFIPPFISDVSEHGLKGRRVQKREVSSGSMVMGGGCRWCGLYLKATPANPRCGAASGSARWQARHMPIQEMDPHLAQWEGPIPTLAQPKKWNIIYHLKHTRKQINGVTDIVGFLVFRTEQYPCPKPSQFLQIKVFS